MNTTTHKRFTNISASVLVLLSITLATGCSQKPNAEENSAQIQAAVDKAVAEAKQQFIADQQAADKAKQEAAAQDEEKRKHSPRRCTSSAPRERGCFSSRIPRSPTRMR